MNQKLSDQIVRDLEIPQQSPNKKPIKQLEVYDGSFSYGGSFGVRVNQSGKKVFFLIYQLNGKRHRTSLGVYPVVDLESAKSKALGVLRKVSQGRNPVNEKVSTSDLFDSFSGEFFSKYVVLKCKSSTYREYQRIVAVELMPRFKSRLLSDIKRRDVLKLVDEFRSKGSLVMAKRTLAVLSKLFNYAISKGLVDENPVKGLKLEVEQKTFTRFLSLEELSSLWALLSEEAEPISSIFKLIILTGQKPGAILGLKWSALGFDFIEVNSRGDGLRKIYLTPQIRQILERLSASRDDSEFVFAGRGSSNSLESAPVKNIRKASARLSEKLNRKMLSIKRKFSPSDLARTVEGRMFQLGIRQDVLDYIAGRKIREQAYGLNESETDYFAEAKNALIIWNRKISEITSGIDRPAGDSDKVVQLFR